MRISCVCPTHGRAHVIGEAVESFRRQTYTGEIAERFSDAISEAFDDRKPKRRSRW